MVSGYNGRPAPLPSAALRVLGPWLRELFKVDKRPVFVDLLRRIDVAADNVKHDMRWPYEN